MKYSKITISGKICSGKSTLFNQLKKKLGWPSYSTGEQFRQYVKDHHLILENAEEQNEKLTKKIDYQVRDLLHKKGNLIVDGWMSGIMAADCSDTLRILLVCDDIIRAKRFANREKVTLREAIKKVETRQQNWIERLKKIYNRSDFFESKNYDLVIDTTLLDSHEVFQKVMSHLV